MNAYIITNDGINRFIPRTEGRTGNIMQRKYDYDPENMIMIQKNMILYFHTSLHFAPEYGCARKFKFRY